MLAIVILAGALTTCPPVRLKEAKEAADLWYNAEVDALITVGGGHQGNWLSGPGGVGDIEKAAEDEETAALALTLRSAVCSEKELANSDAALNSAYKRLGKGYSGDEWHYIKDAQRAWIKFRNAAAAVTCDGVVKHDVVCALTKLRAKQLAEWAKEAN